MKLSSQKDWTSNLPIELSQDEKELFPEPPMKLSGPRNTNLEILDYMFSERKNEQSEEISQKTREELARVLPTLKECKRTGRLLKWTQGKWMKVA